MKRMKHVMAFAAAIGLLALTAHTAPGQSGRKDEPKAVLTFDDFAGDAIQSDGLGPYEASVEVYGGTASLTMKSRSLYLDFSDCYLAGVSCDGVFGAGETTGEVASGFTMDFYNLRGAPGTVGETQVFITFREGGKWQLQSMITVYRLGDEDGDGFADEYILEDPGTVATALVGFVNNRAPFSNLDGYDEWHGSYFMPWGATLSLP